MTPRSKFLSDFNEPLISIDQLLGVMEKNRTANTILALKNLKGFQIGTLVIADEQFQREGLSGLVKAISVATCAEMVLIQTPVEHPALDKNKSENHWNWFIAAKVDSESTKELFLGETISTETVFIANLVQKLDEQDWYQLLPNAFQELHRYVGITDLTQVEHARSFLETEWPDIDFNWDQYEN